MSFDNSYSLNTGDGLTVVPGHNGISNTVPSSQHQQHQQRDNREEGELGDEAIAPNTGFVQQHDDEVSEISLVQQSIEGFVVCATNIAQEVTDEDIMDLFAEYGAVRAVHLNLDRKSGYVKGYALIEFREYEEAAAAVLNLHHTNFAGRQISVDFAFSARPLRNIQRIADAN